VIAIEIAHEYTASGNKGDNVVLAVTVIHWGDPSLHTAIVAEQYVAGVQKNPLPAACFIAVWMPVRQLGVRDAQSPDGPDLTTAYVAPA
jgi:hypothetical protein